MATTDREFLATPRVLRRHASIWTIVLPGSALLGWFALPAPIRAQFTGPQVATLLGFLAIMLGVVWIVSVARVEAGPWGLRFRNGLRRHELAWSEVESIRYRSGDPWAFAELVDGSDRALMGIMRTDGPRADGLVSELRALRQRHTPPAAS